MYLIVSASFCFKLLLWLPGGIIDETSQLTTVWRNRIEFLMIVVATDLYLPNSCIGYMKVIGEISGWLLRTSHLSITYHDSVCYFLNFEVKQSLREDIFFWFDLFLEAWVEILETFFCFLGGRFEDIKRTFWN